MVFRIVKKHTPKNGLLERSTYYIKDLKGRSLYTRKRLTGFNVVLTKKWFYSSDLEQVPSQDNNSTITIEQVLELNNVKPNKYDLRFLDAARANDEEDEDEDDEEDDDEDEDEDKDKDKEEPEFDEEPNYWQDDEPEPPPAARRSSRQRKENDFTRPIPQGLTLEEDRAVAQYFNKKK
jgi:hypothetical protein